MFNKKPQNGQRNVLRAGVSMLAAAAGAMTATPAFAQDSDDEIIVTGSRIPQRNLETSSPVTQVTAQDITTQGVTRVEDLVNQLPQVFAAQASTVSNGASGTAQVDLRSLGPTRTLVLINGKRMPYGSPVSPAADLNQIPGPLIERVEVLTGGASAVYGSDAIAGVVNFIMRDDFEGLRLDAQYGFFQHHNDFDDNDGVVPISEVVAGRNFEVPHDDIMTGYGREITAIFGASLGDGRGNVTAYANYRNNSEILQRDFDYSACSLNAGSGVTGGSWACGGSDTSFPGLYFSDIDPTLGSYTVDATTGNTFRPYNAGTDRFNFGPVNYFQRPDERYGMGAFAHYEINDHVEAYADLMFTDYRTVAQIAPSGSFFLPIATTCDNALLSAQQSATLGCAAQDGSPVTIYVARRNVEGGGRRDNYGYTSYRGLVGARGALNESWDYDVSLQYSRVQMNRFLGNYLANNRITNALDVVDVGAGPQCRVVVTGADPTCVPWNIFEIGGVTPAALTYMAATYQQQGFVTQQGAVGTVTGEMPFGTPWAETNVLTAFGVEYRREGLEISSDEASLRDQTFGPSVPFSDFDVFEVFGEARIPIAENQPFAEELGIDLAYRYSAYQSGVSTDTYKIGGEWAPTEDVRLRGSFQHAVRTANVVELFSPQSFNLFDMADDPCDLQDDGGNGIAPEANCVGPNPWQMSQTIYDNSPLISSPAGQYNFLQGGNPGLTPEESDTYTYGVVFTPRFLPGLVVSIDHFDIEVTDVVAINAPDGLVNSCFLDGDLSACADITRNPNNGTLWVTTTGFVTATNQNLTSFQTTGYDIDVSYSFDIGSFGALNASLVGTKLDSINFGGLECVGFFSGGCGIPYPEWRHRARLAWDTPWEALQLSGTWRHYGEVNNIQRAPGVGLDSTFSAQNYLDIAGNYDLFENTNLRFGINNVIDNDPPISQVVGTTGNGNTYPQTYDATGRFVFAGVTVDF